MPIATQIRSFAVTADIWMQGTHLQPMLSPLDIPAQDALAIERRATKNVNLHNEGRRYTLCCERMQGMVEDLHGSSSAARLLHTWPALSGKDLPSARALLTIMEAMRSWLRWVNGQQPSLVPPYLRFAAIFFPPDHAIRHFEAFDAILRIPQSERLFEGAAKRTPTGAGFNVTADECRAAFNVRHSLLKELAVRKEGLVEVFDIDLFSLKTL